MEMNMKYTIAVTLRELAKKKPLDKITVKDIVDACGISRQTFYYHFHDIMEVIEWSAYEAIHHLVDEVLPSKTQEQGIRLVVSFFFQNKETWSRILMSKRRYEFENTVKQVIQNYMVNYITTKNPEEKGNSRDVELFVHFLTYGLGGIFMEYANRYDVTEEEFADQLIRMLSIRQCRQ